MFFVYIIRMTWLGLTERFNYLLDMQSSVDIFSPQSYAQQRLNYYRAQSVSRNFALPFYVLCFALYSKATQTSAMIATAAFLMFLIGLCTKLCTLSTKSSAFICSCKSTAEEALRAFDFANSVKTCKFTHKNLEDMLQANFN